MKALPKKAPAYMAAAVPAAKGSANPAVSLSTVI